MRLKAIVAGLVMALMFYCAAAFAATPAGVDKVGVINMQKVMMESKAGKEAKANFDKELESKRAIWSGKEKSVRAAEEDLKTGGAKMKAGARKEKEGKLAEEIKELRRMKQDIEDELKKKDNELTSKILKDILEVTRKVGDERGYSLVIQAGPQVVYTNKTVDITDEVLKRYDSGR